MGTLQIGDTLPDVELTGDAGPVKLANVLGHRTAVVYFYPKDETPGCTAEACTFRDAYEDFAGAGAVVVGISRDSLESHGRFKARHQLPFTLLSDPEGKAAALFGVKRTLGVLPGRSTFVIDRQGVVRHRFDSQLRVGEHVKQALEIVLQLEGRAVAPVAQNSAS